MPDVAKFIIYINEMNISLIFKRLQFSCNYFTVPGLGFKGLNNKILASVACIFKSRWICIFDLAQIFTPDSLTIASLPFIQAWGHPRCYATLPWFTARRKHFPNLFESGWASGVKTCAKPNMQIHPLW